MEEENNILFVGMYRGNEEVDYLKKRYGSANGALVRDAIRVEKVKELLTSTKVYTMNRQEKIGNCPTHIAGEIDIERNALITSGITFTLLHFDYIHMPAYYFMNYLLKDSFLTQVLPLLIEKNIISIDGEIW